MMGEGRNPRGAEKSRTESFIPAFDVALWGYDRQQVKQCLADMTRRLEEAFRRLDSVEFVESQLREAQVEIDELRAAVEDRPGAAGRLSKIMFVAEQLRKQAAEDAEAIRARARAEVADRVPTT